MTEATIRVQGMTCMGCTHTVANAIRNVEGVGLVKVSLDEKAAEVMFDEKQVDLDKIRKAI